MIYVTGDIHGQAPIVAEVLEKHRINREDLIVLLGDVGVNFYGNAYGDRWLKRELNRFGIKILCIHGNHEIRPETIPTYQEKEWHDGVVYVEEEYPNLLFTKDGEIYDLEGLKAVAIGGAYSVDKNYRLNNGLPWFPDEQPSEEIKARVEQKLERLEWKVDVVLSHTCPYRYIPQERYDYSNVDSSTELWLDSIAEKLDFQAWYCGHWHIEKRIDQMHFLYESVECLQPEYGNDAEKP